MSDIEAIKAIPTEQQVEDFLKRNLVQFFKASTPVLAAFTEDHKPFPHVVPDTKRNRHLKIWWALIGAHKHFLVYMFPDKFEALKAMAGEDPLPYAGDMVLETNEVDKDDGRGPLWSFRRDDLYWHKIPRNWQDNVDPSTIGSINMRIDPTGPFLINNTWFRGKAFEPFEGWELEEGARIMTREGFPTYVGGHLPQPTDIMKGALTRHWSARVKERWSRAVDTTLKEMEALTRAIRQLGAEHAGE